MSKFEFTCPRATRGSIVRKHHYPMKKPPLWLRSKYRDDRHRTPYSLSLSLNRDQLINNFPSLTVYFLPSKLSAADARTQHQPPPVVTPRGKTTDSRKTRQLSHTFLPLLLLLLPTDPIPLFHVALLVSSNPHRETIFRASPYSSSRYSSPSSTFSPRMKNLPWKREKRKKKRTRI